MRVKIKCSRSDTQRAMMGQNQKETRNRGYFTVTCGVSLAVRIRSTCSLSEFSTRQMMRAKELKCWPRKQIPNLTERACFGALSLKWRACHFHLDSEWVLFKDGAHLVCVLFRRIALPRPWTFSSRFARICFVAAPDGTQCHLLSGICAIWCDVIRLAWANGLFPRSADWTRGLQLLFTCTRNEGNMLFAFSL